MTQQDLRVDRGRPVTWYCCGPTVYSHSHLGHARCYVVFDAMRRILEARLGLAVHYAMNVTDVDDKIIRAAAEAGTTAAAVAQHWEADFFAQMARLNVRLPDRVLRVSEHVPDIVRYVEAIEANGFCYEAAGSVYFDVGRFRQAGFSYCKLAPLAARDDSPPDAGDSDMAQHKKSPADFVLWKQAKAGEPSWPSKWGPGRPGWHIECSAMIQTLLDDGQKLTLHSGGSDLKFPHHANEIAQGEAYTCESDWVRYFVHCAPLVIRGLKMSKSLKNFVTVREALEHVTGRQLRLLILLHKYTSPMAFDADSSYAMAVEKDRYIEAFVGSLEAAVNAGRQQPGGRFDAEEVAMDRKVTEASLQIDECLADNFDTGGALAVFTKLAKDYNVLVQAKGRLSPVLAGRIWRLSEGFLSMLGLDYGRPRQAASDSDLLAVLVEFRNGVLDGARRKDIKSVFEACDSLRDEHLPRLGIRVEDGKPGWQTIDPTEARKPSIKNDKLNTGEPGIKPTANEKKDDTDRITGKTPREVGEHLFRSKKYDKFDIGEIGDSGLPLKDRHGRDFPPKVADRFRRDLARELESSGMPS